MEISAAQYVVLGNGDRHIRANIDGKELAVPLDTDNRHYAAILEWSKEDDNEIAEAD